MAYDSVRCSVAGYSERWIDLLDSALRSCARFNSGSLCFPPLNLCCLGRRRCCGFKAEKAEGAWFCAERGHWPPASCINFLSFTFPSRKPAPVALAHSPPACFMLFRGKLPYKYYSRGWDLGRLKSADGIRWSYDGYFLLLKGVWQRCRALFCGGRRRRDAATSAVYGL